MHLKPDKSYCIINYACLLSHQTVGIQYYYSFTACTGYNHVNTY